MKKTVWEKITDWLDDWFEIVCFSAFVAFLTTIIVIGVKELEKQQTYHENGYANEWVSVDGVHYWKCATGIAPRYDSNGNLVIDKGGAE